MSQHDFIFSDYFRHRIARHAAFWIASYLFFCVVFYIPTGVFPAWNTEMFAKNVARLGFPTWLKWRVFNSTIVFIPNLLLAYAIIYIVLPRQFFNKKNAIVTISLLAGIFILVFVSSYYLSWLIEWNNKRINPSVPAPDHNRRISQIIKNMLFNVPVMCGFAVIIKMMKRSWLKQQETLQVIREKVSAEVQLLKAQIHPHFLFNTLNNVYFFTLTGSPKAPEILLKLTDMLRYILDECSAPLVPLAKEIKMIEDYMALEKIRYGNRLKMELEIKGDYLNKMITPLLLIPLVENSFKHGTSKMLEHPWVNLNITIDGQHLFFLLSNSRPDQTTAPHHNGHIGLNNVKKRLQLLYPAAHELSIVTGSQSFEVFMKISLEKASETGVENLVQNKRLGYEMV